MESKLECSVLNLYELTQCCDDVNVKEMMDMHVWWIWCSEQCSYTVDCKCTVWIWGVVHTADSRSVYIVYTV